MRGCLLFPNCSITLFNNRKPYCFSVRVCNEVMCLFALRPTTPSYSNDVPVCKCEKCSSKDYKIITPSTITSTNLHKPATPPTLSKALFAQLTPSNLTTNRFLGYRPSHNPTALSSERGIASTSSATTPFFWSNMTSSGASMHELGAVDWEEPFDFDNWVNFPPDEVDQGGQEG